MNSQSQLCDERGHDIGRLVGLEPAQLRGRGPQHRRQGHQRNGHGKDAQRTGGHLVGYGLPARSCEWKSQKSKLCLPLIISDFHLRSNKLRTYFYNFLFLVLNSNLFQNQISKNPKIICDLKPNLISF